MPKKSGEQTSSNTYDQPKNINPIPPKPPIPQETPADKIYNSQMELLTILRPQKNNLGEYFYNKEETQKKIDDWLSNHEPKINAKERARKQKDLYDFAELRLKEYAARKNGELPDPKIQSKMKKYSAEYFGNGGFEKIDLSNISPEAQDIIRARATRAENKYHINQTLRELAGKGRIGAGILELPKLVSSKSIGSTMQTDGLTSQITVQEQENKFLHGVEDAKYGYFLPGHADISLQEMSIGHEFDGHAFHNAAAWRFCEKIYPEYKQLSANDRKRAFIESEAYLEAKVWEKCKEYVASWDGGPTPKNVQRATNEARKARGYSGYGDTDLGEWFAEARSHMEDTPPSNWNSMDYAIYEITKDDPEKLSEFAYKEFVQDHLNKKYVAYLDAGYYKSKKLDGAILDDIGYKDFINSCTSKLKPSVIEDLSNAVKLKALSIVRSTDVDVINRKKEDLKLTLDRMEKMTQKEFNDLYLKHREKVDGGFEEIPSKNVKENPLVLQSKGTLAWRNALNEVKKKVQKEQKVQEEQKEQKVQEGQAGPKRESISLLKLKTSALGKNPNMKPILTKAKAPEALPKEDTKTLPEELEGSLKEIEQLTTPLKKLKGETKPGKSSTDTSYENYEKLKKTVTELNEYLSAMKSAMKKKKVGAGTIITNWELRQLIDKNNKIKNYAKTYLSGKGISPYNLGSDQASITKYNSYDEATKQRIDIVKKALRTVKEGHLWPSKYASRTQDAQFAAHHSL